MVEMTEAAAILHRAEDPELQGTLPDNIVEIINREVVLENGYVDEGKLTVTGRPTGSGSWCHASRMSALSTRPASVCADVWGAHQRPRPQV